MDGAQPEKREKVHELMKTLREFFHFGRHERGEKIQLERGDAEMALLCATALLGYLGPYYVPRKKELPKLR